MRLAEVWGGLGHRDRWSMLFNRCAAWREGQNLCLQNKGWVTGPGNPAVDQLLECFPSVLKAVLPACLQLLPSGLTSLGNLLSFQGVALCTGGPTAAAWEERTTSFLGLQFFSCEIEKVSDFP